MFVCVCVSLFLSFRWKANEFTADSCFILFRVKCTLSRANAHIKHVRHILTTPPGAHESKDTSITKKRNVLSWCAFIVSTGDMNKLTNLLVLRSCLYTSSWRSVHYEIDYHLTAGCAYVLQNLGAMNHAHHILLEGWDLSRFDWKTKTAMSAYPFICCLDLCDVWLFSLVHFGFIEVM